MRLTELLYRPYRARKKRSFLKDRRGVTAIEFALVAFPFLLLSIGIIEIGLAHLVNRMLDNAVVSASRLIKTGQADDGAITKDQFKQQVCDYMPSFMCDLDRITMEVTPYDSFTDAQNLDSLYDEDGNLKSDDQLKFDPGDPKNIVVVNVLYKWPMFTSFLSLNGADTSGERLLSSTMVFRNEPWS